MLKTFSLTGCPDNCLETTSYFEYFLILYGKYLFSLVCMFRLKLLYLCLSISLFLFTFYHPGIFQNIWTIDHSISYCYYYLLLFTLLNFFFVSHTHVGMENRYRCLIWNHLIFSIFFWIKIFIFIKEKFLFWKEKKGEKITSFVAAWGFPVLMAFPPILFLARKTSTIIMTSPALSGV